MLTAHGTARLSAALLGLVTATAANAQGNDLLYSNPSNSSYTATESYTSPLSPFPTAVQAADDFTAVGTIERVTVHGKECFPCQPADIASVVVQFYEWTPAGPGALLSRQEVFAGDPRLVYDPGGVDDIEITLPEPFAANGQGYVSVQPEMGIDDGYWGWWISNHEAPTNSRLWWRDLNDGLAWGAYEVSSTVDLEADLAFSLWGTGDTPPDPGTDPCGQWGVLTTPSPAGSLQAVLRGVAAISDDDVWAVGDVTVEFALGNNDTLAHAQHWDGVRWTIVPMPVPSPYPGGDSASLTAVAAGATDDVWAAGYYATPGDDGDIDTEVLIVHWDGSEWDVVPNAPLLQQGVSGAWIRGIEIIAPDDIWFVGDYPILSAGGLGVRYAGAIHWDGSEFTIFETPLNNSDNNGLSAVSAIASDDIWAVGGGYGDGFMIKPYLLHFDGSSWNLVEAPEPGITNVLLDVDAIASDDVWAIGQTQTENGIEGFAMHWDGNAWSIVPFSGGSRGLHAFASDDVYAVGGVVSHWDGSSWSEVEKFSGVLSPSLGAVTASAPCKLFAVGRQSIGGNLLNHSVKLDADPWTDAGGASPSAPTLTAEGNLESGSKVTLHASGLPADALTRLVIGRTAIYRPLPGATLVPAPRFVVPDLLSNAFGRIDYSLTWPAGMPAGGEIYLQMLSNDPVAGGLVSSNALHGISP